MMTKEGSIKIVNFMIPGTGVLALGCGHISKIVKRHYFFKKSSSVLPGIDHTNLVYSNDNQGRVVIVKVHYSFKNLLLYSQA